MYDIIEILTEHFIERNKESIVESCKVTYAKDIISDIYKNIESVHDKKFNRILFESKDSYLLSGIAGYYNLKEVANDLSSINENAYLLSYPTCNEVSGEFKIDLYNLIESCNTIDDLKKVNNFFIKLKAMNEKRFYNENAFNKWKRYFEKSIFIDEVNALLFKFPEWKEKKDDLICWLDENCKENGFQFDYNLEKLKESMNK